MSYSNDVNMNEKYEWMSKMLPQSFIKEVSQLEKAGLEEDEIFHDCKDTEEEKNKTNTVYNSIQSTRELCGKIANHWIFSTFIFAIILVNAAMMGISTFDFVTEDPKIEATFELVDRIFLIIFTIEVSLQFLYRGLNLFLEGWLVFDLLIVAFSWALDSLQVVRAFRIFRMLRLISRIEAVKDLVVALLSIIPRMSAIIFLMLLIVYIFAVMFTTLYKNVELEAPYFTRLDHSFFTLFQMLTLDWAELTRELMEKKSAAWLPTVIYVNISSLIVYNLVVAVICDAIVVLKRLKMKKGTKQGAIEVDKNGKDPTLAFKRFLLKVNQLSEREARIKLKMKTLAGLLLEIKQQEERRHKSSLFSSSSSIHSKPQYIKLTQESPYPKDVSDNSSIISKAFNSFVPMNG